jgi:hypothetical protein
MDDMDMETPPDDALEQERPVVETDDDEDPLPHVTEIPLDANEADVVEQEQTVETDDEDDHQ